MSCRRLLFGNASARWVIKRPRYDAHSLSQVLQTCENDGELQIYNPWGADAGVKVVSEGAEHILEGRIIKIRVKEEQQIRISKKL